MPSNSSSARNERRDKSLQTCTSTGPNEDWPRVFFCFIDECKFYFIGTGGTQYARWRKSDRLLPKCVKKKNQVNLFIHWIA